MITTQAVFFDGISGSGKSTTSQLIYLDLLAKGIHATWYYEHEHPHPIVSTPEIDGALKNEMPWEQVFTQILDRTSTLANDMSQTDRVPIFESCFYQIIAGYLFRMNRPHREIIECMLQLEEHLLPLQPHLIYFYQHDVKQALHQICLRRGDGFDRYLLDRFIETPYGKAHGIQDFDALANAYAAFRAITDELVTITNFQVISFNTAKEDWPTVLERVASFIGAGPYQGPQQPPQGLQAYTGTYREPQSGHTWKLVVQDHALMLDDEFRARLHPYKTDVFLIEGVTIELQFHRDHHGSIESIHCGGDVTGEPLIGTVWKKVE